VLIVVVDDAGSDGNGESRGSTDEHWSYDCDIAICLSLRLSVCNIIIVSL